MPPGRVGGSRRQTASGWPVRTWQDPVAPSATGSWAGVPAHQVLRAVDVRMDQMVAEGLVIGRARWEGSDRRGGLGGEELRENDEDEQYRQQDKAQGPNRGEGRRLEG